MVLKKIYQKINEYSEYCIYYECSEPLSSSEYYKFNEMFKHTQKTSNFLNSDVIEYGSALYFETPMSSNIVDILNRTGIHKISRVEKTVRILKDYFDIDNWRINEPIYLSKLYVLLDGVRGVQTVVRPDNNGNGGLEVFNRFNGNYAPNKYSIRNATRDGIIHPPKDPSIFEIKFPDVDIRGRVVTATF